MDWKGKEWIVNQKHTSNLSKQKSEKQHLPKASDKKRCLQAGGQREDTAHRINEAGLMGTHRDLSGNHRTFMGLQEVLCLHAVVAWLGVLVGLLT